MNRSFAIGEKDFLLDGKPFRIISGAMHYFRVPREYWRDRLLKLKACGFNTVETYVAWNMHEPQEGQFDFEGMLDLEAYLSLIQELGLYAILRPGPYICSEWEFGGLPWWLLKNDDMELRCADPAYLAAVDRFYDELIPRIVPHQIDKGGNVILLQNENEYGSYGDDGEYLRYLADGLVRRGITVPLFSSDGVCHQMLTGGTLPDIHKTANFGSRPRENFEGLREYQPKGPLMCAEYWNGWFDHWEEEHHHRDPADAAACLDEILAAGASVSAYMFHGGTTFGYMNGANFYDVYQPTVNSYDDDAPLNENGQITEKYRLFRDVIAKYREIPEVELPAPILPKRYGELRFTRFAKLLDNLDTLSAPQALVAPRPMEKLGQGYGYILYRCRVKGPREEQILHFDSLHDRAYVYADGKFIGKQYINDKEDSIPFTVPAGGSTLDVLVENMGRINYGRFLADRKGVTHGIGAGNNFFYHWQAYTLPFDNTDKLTFTEGTPVFDGTPLFMQADLEIADEPCDTFVKLPGFGKGIIIVNGKVLSRYWEVGPQRSAYLPAPFLRKGHNTVTVLETEHFTNPAVLLDDTADIG